MSRRKATIIAVLAVAVCLGVVSAVYMASRRGSQAGGPAGHVAAQREPQPLSPDDSETKRLMAAAEQLGRATAAPALEQLKDGWRSKHGAGQAGPDELRAWFDFCTKLRDRSGAAEWARAIWDVVVMRPPAATVRLADVEEALRLNGSPDLTPEHPWSARIHEVLSCRLSRADMSIPELNEWLALRLRIRGLLADAPEARAIMDVLARWEWNSTELPDRSFRTAADILRETPGMNTAEERLTDETGMVSLPVAKVLTWVHTYDNKGKRYQHDVGLLQFIRRLEETEKGDLRGDAVAMCRLAIAYATSMFMERSGRRMNSRVYKIALAAVQSDDMVMLCLEEIASTARAAADYDYALSVLDGALGRLTDGNRSRAEALQQELSELKSKPPPKPARPTAPQPPPRRR